MSALIDPVYAEIYQVDTAAIEAYDPPGPTASGYDPVFRTITLVDSNEDGKFESSRQESAPVLVPCQVEYETFEKQSMSASGDVPSSRLKLVFDFCELKDLGLIDALGKPFIRKNDRVTRILHCDAVTLIQSFEDERTGNEGLFVSEVLTTFGFGSAELVIATLEQRRIGFTK